MGLFGTDKPNVKALVRHADVEGLVEAATFQDLIPSRDGTTADLGVPIREEAILGLGALAPDAGNGTVSGALADPSDRVRVAAVRVLYAREEVHPLAEALGWLPADHGHARRLAIQAIAELRQPDSARVLAGALVRARGEDPVGDEEVELLDSLIEAGKGSETTTAVIDELLSALADERQDVVDRAEELLARLSPTSLDGVIAELKGGKAAHRAASVLGRIKDTRAMEPLAEALEDLEARVRAESARALGELRDPAAVEPLMRATRDPDHSVRAQAGWALDRIGTVAVMVGVSHLVRPMIHEAVSSAVKGNLPAASQRAALPGGPAPKPDGGKADRAENHANGADGADTTDPTVLRRLARFLDRIEDARNPEDPLKK